LGHLTGKFYQEVVHHLTGGWNMIRAMLVAIIALFALSFTPISSAHEANDGDGVVWGT
jgi:hypothetical protein